MECFGIRIYLDFRQDLRSWASVVPAHAQKPIFGKRSELINRTRQQATLKLAPTQSGSQHTTTDPGPRDRTEAHHATSAS